MKTKYCAIPVKEDCFRAFKFYMATKQAKTADQAIRDLLGPITFAEWQKAEAAKQEAAQEAERAGI